MTTIKKSNKCPICGNIMVLRGTLGRKCIVCGFRI